MSSEFMKHNNSAWGSMTSSTRSSTCSEADYPILVEIAKQLINLHSPNEDGRPVDSLASGTILCDIVSDYIASEFIGDYHRDAKNYSQQADDNLSTFGVACEKMQIPRSCIATSNDFKEKNYKKIELTLVLFVIRGMAYSLPQVSDDLINKLKDYKFTQYPTHKKDLVICERILKIFRDDGNNKDIPVDTEAIDGSESSEDEKKRMVIDPVDFDSFPPDQENKQEDQEGMEPSESDDVKEDIPSAMEAISDEESVDEVPTVNPSLPLADEKEGMEPSAHEAFSDDGSVDEVNPDENPSLSLVDEGMEPSESDDVRENEGSVHEAISDEDSVDEVVSSITPSYPLPGEQEGMEPSESDDVKEEDIPPFKPEPESIEESDDVDDVPSKPEPQGETESDVEQDEEIRQGPRVVVIPREPEVITQSNDPDGFDIDPRETEEEQREREERERIKKERKKEHKEIELMPESQPIEFKHTSNDISTIIGKPQKRPVKWYIVALFIVLMLICLACSIVCGVFLAKVNN